jgi:hypothetical protein
MIKTKESYGSAGELFRYKPENGTPKGVILFLHGLGEIAAEGPLSIVEKNEIPKQLRKLDPLTGLVTNPTGVEAEYEIIAPQLNGTSWSRTALRDLFKYLDGLGYDRKICTGLSLGGMATLSAINHAYEWNGNQPGYFKAFGVVCGKITSTPRSEKLVGSIVRWWHGLSDSTITFKESGAALHTEIWAGDGIDATLKTYPGVGHNSWSRAYNPTDLESFWQWIKKLDVADEQVTIVKNGDTLIAVTLDGKRFKINATLEKSA